MSTTIRVESGTRDKLRTFGTKGMSYDDILNQLMSRVTREEFIEHLRALERRQDFSDWVDLEDT